MSYVIQNYCFNQKINSQTPRLNSLILLNNLKLFLIFIKYKLFFVLFKSEKYFQTNVLNKLTPYFFHYFYFNKLQTLDFSYMGFYTNNLNKSFIYWTYRIIKMFLLKKESKAGLNLYLEKNSFLNQYFTPVVVANTPLNLNKFKNFFYFNFFLLSFAWFQYNTKMKFNQNFIFSIENLFLSPIFSGYFFKIYKY